MCSGLSLIPNITLTSLGHIFLIITILTFFSWKYLNKKKINPIFPLVITLCFYISAGFFKQNSSLNSILTIYFPILTIMLLSSSLGIIIGKKNRTIYQILSIIFIILTILIYYIANNIVYLC
ncbi:MAG: hypothetical protein WC867_07920 [Candidatus Pacearchaeota archaeon]|jgi:hypothetical protein